MKNKQTKRSKLKHKLILCMTASLILIFAAFLIREILPGVFGYIKSSITYTPNISVYSEYAKDFILKYTPK